MFIVDCVCCSFFFSSKRKLILCVWMIWLLSIRRLEYVTLLKSLAYKKLKVVVGNWTDNEQSIYQSHTITTTDYFIYFRLFSLAHNSLSYVFNYFTYAHSLYSTFFSVFFLCFFFACCSYFEIFLFNFFPLLRFIYISELQNENAPLFHK